MNSSHPHSYRIQIHRVAEVRDVNGATHRIYPQILWQEKPGDELTNEWVDRWAHALKLGETFSLKGGYTVSLATINVYDEHALPTHIYTESVGLPAMQRIARGEVQIERKAVVS